VGDRSPIDFVIFPYRDGYFHGRYGCAVRDLHIIDALRHHPRVGRMVLVNRPVSLYERVLGKWPQQGTAIPGVEFIDTTAFDLRGPLHRRAWTERCYERATAIAAARFAGRCSPVLLDFTPIARIDYSRVSAKTVWYDVIDNFTRHNRYSPMERALVECKYKQVEAGAALVTGVSDAALARFAPDRRLTIANGIVARPRLAALSRDAVEVGFIGFVTDKFDVAAVEALVESTGVRVVIHGRVYDHATAARLKAIPQVRLRGAFHHRELPAVMASFRIGLVPYLEARSHDGSPIKLYEYLAFGKPVLCAPLFGAEGEFVGELDAARPEASARFVDEMLSAGRSDECRFMWRVSSSLPLECTWRHKIDRVIERIAGA